MVKIGYANFDVLKNFVSVNETDCKLWISMYVSDRQNNCLPNISLP